MGKSIVICCDGTSNDFGDCNSNVVKLFSLLEKKTGRQVVYYDPGVGTRSSYSAFLPTTQTLMRWLGLAFGYGISQNVMDAYGFLMRHYEPGDDVYLFGFSRGAYTIRAVAGLIYKCGLLQPDNTNLIPEAMRIFRMPVKSSDKVPTDFRETFCRPEFKIRFVGLWDTVTSVGWIYSPTIFPYSTRNPSVLALRQAISIDERRAFFRQNIFRADKKSPGQDIKQVWFAGVHSDVGGGYEDARSGLSNIALEWMLLEAMGHGLEIEDVDRARAMVNSIPDNHKADQNEELKGAWLLGEFWPKWTYIPRKSLYWPFPWIYANVDGVRLPHLNLFRRRFIGDSTKLHQSVSKRVLERADYRPSNLVDKNGKFKLALEEEPWRRI
jgi:uncharacterized protein (DUF2235 family)